MPSKRERTSSLAGRCARGDASRPGLRRTHGSPIRNVPDTVPNSWSKSGELAIQLLLDPHVTALAFRASLSFLGREVPLRMFVADLDDGGRVAFDIIDERLYRDLDTEGLLLLALESHNVRLIEIDHSEIDAEPRASNTRRLWSHREHQVPAPIKAAVDRALATRQRLSIRSLARIAGLRDPMPTIGALVSQGILAVDPSKPLGSNSIVARRSDPWRFPIAKSSRFSRANP